MAYTRRNVTDGETVLNKELYDNLQDGIDENKKAITSIGEALDLILETQNKIITGGSEI
jgi:hypothetical protein